MYCFEQKISLSDKHRHCDGEDSYRLFSARPTYAGSIIAYTLTMRCPRSCVMMPRRSTGAKLCSLIIAILATGSVGKVFAGESVCRPPFDSRLLADQSAPGESNDVRALRKAAEEGDAHAQFSLGLRYERDRKST